MSKHTPGPWKVAAIPGAVIAMDNTTIAKVFYGERSVCDANARLIAAAPELFEALGSALRLGDHDGACKAMARGGPEDCICWVAAAHAAIAKAEGKS